MRFVSGDQVPGSPWPLTLVDSYIPSPGAPADEPQWSIIGTDGFALAWHAVSLAEEMWLVDGKPSWHYWTEHDYLADLMTLNKLNDTARTRDDLWMAYDKWDRDFQRLKNIRNLIFDWACMATTPYQQYETFDFLAYRHAQVLPTIVCMSKKYLSSTTPAIRGLLQNYFRALVVDAKGQWDDAVG